MKTDRANRATGKLGGPSSREFAYRLQRAIARIVLSVEQGAYWVACLLLCFLVIALFLQVLFRYVLQSPLPWSEEAARFALIWLSFLAAVVAANEGQHFVFRWVTLALSGRCRYILRRFIDIVMIAMLALLIYESMKYVNISSSKHASGTGLNVAVPVSGVLVGLVGLLIIYIGELLDGLLSALTGKHCSKRELSEERVHQILAGD